MPNKFVTSWKMTGGEVTPSVREIGAAYDNLMPLILAAGGAIGPAGLAIAQGFAAEDDQQQPLHIARLSPANLFPVLMVPSFVAAMQQLTTMFLSTFTPPTPPQALAAWQATPVGGIPGPSSLKLATAMSIYMSGAFLGGLGDPRDAPPPPEVGAEPPLPLAAPLGATSIFRYDGNSSDPSLPSPYVRLTSYVVPRVNLDKPDIQVYSWQIDDAGVNIGALTGTVYGASRTEPERYEGNSKIAFFLFPYVGNFDVKLTVCNSAGSISETRTVFSG